MQIEHHVIPKKKKKLPTATITSSSSASSSASSRCTGASISEGLLGAAPVTEEEEDAERNEKESNVGVFCELVKHDGSSLGSLAVALAF